MVVVESTEIVGGEDLAIRVEVDNPLSASLREVYGETRFGPKTVERTQNLFDSGLQLARACAAQTVESMHTMEEAHRPDEFQMQLAIKLDGEFGAYLVKLTAEAQMQVTMIWRR